MPFLKTSIALGAARSVDYSYLASAQTLSGDDEGAASTFAEAALMYPRSVFVLTRYAALLEKAGRGEESRVMRARAEQIDPPAAKTWWTLITKGALAATNDANRDADLAKVMDLQPAAAMYAVLTERYVTHPEEQTMPLPH